MEIKIQRNRKGDNMAFNTTTLYQLVINTDDQRLLATTKVRQNLLFSSAVALLTELTKWHFIPELKKKISSVKPVDIANLEQDSCIEFSTHDGCYSGSVCIIKRRCIPSKQDFMKFFNRYSTHESLFTKPNADVHVYEKVES